MKDIKGFEGRYAITEDGRVWSYKKYHKGGWLSLSTKKSGYVEAILYDGDKNHKKHY